MLLTSNSSHLRDVARPDKSIRVALVSDSILLRQALGTAIELADDMGVELECNTSELSTDCQDTVDVDVMILDLNNFTPACVIMAERILSKCKELKTVVIGDSLNMYWMERLLGMGAKGIVSTRSDVQELIWSIYAVHEGHQFMDQNTSMLWEGGHQDQSDGSHVAKPLTNRELEIVQLSSDGLASKQVAAELSLSKRTIDAHKRNIFRKLEMNSMNHVIKHCVNSGWVR